MIFSTELRRLPVVCVDGVRYVVDVRRGQLRQINDSRRVFWFERAVAEVGE
ncbi:MAG: hypothetical protein IID42_00045 [Planctomycetes bacterium]|nr:hypothetical protein [Planctomycetota bacterium]